MQYKMNISIATLMRKYSILAVDIQVFVDKVNQVKTKVAAIL